MAATGDVVDERTLDTYVSHFLSYYDENIATNSAPFPGAVDMLESLRNEGWMLLFAPTNRRPFPSNCSKNWKC